ncbi:hypothetical protein, partial [Candidatus Acetatifactor stercoripullorum]|uniref:hypothetical protein n=1 Tax=Candidatus Acetatifactor stercoripullorum TaxID=2838414 RepID=UPI00298DE0F3
SLKNRQIGTLGGHIYLFTAVCGNSRISISNHKKLSINPFTNRAKVEPFCKTNAGNPHIYRLSAF